MRRTVWEKKAAFIHLVMLILIVKTCDKRRKELASKRTAKYPAELARNDGSFGVVRAKITYSQNDDKLNGRH